MVALHPPLSGMPLAFSVLLIAIELAALRAQWRERLEVTRFVLVTAVVVATLAAFLSGYQASSDLGDLAPIPQAALAEHHAYGRLVLINALVMGVLYVVSRVAVHGRGVVKSLYRITIILQLFLLLLVGSMGGALVFEQGLGVILPTK